MANSNGAYLKGMFNVAKGMGDKVISSDAYFEIVGHEELGMLIKQFPWPILGPAGEIEVPGPLGMATWQAQQAKVNQQGQVTFTETKAGHVQKFLDELPAEGGTFDAKIYEGMPDSYLRMVKIYKCFFVPDNPDRDWENRSQIMTISGTLFFHYFGDYAK